MTPTLLATGWSVHLPGVALAEGLDRPGEWAHADAPAPDRAATLLGRKGLLAKEPATRLALCAVHRALGLPPGRPTGPPSPRTAVVACGNLGNVKTVADIARAVSTEGLKGVSALDAPNASSNVLAGAVALWFGFGGPNLMVCSGATAGADGLRLADLLLRARRADRVVLVGAEPADEVASALHGTVDARGGLLAGAACLVLRRGEEADAVGGAALALLPDHAAWPRPPHVVLGPDGFDPVRHWGDCHGAQGVVSAALAAHLAVDDGHGAVGVRDGSLAVLVEAAGGGGG
uniref:Ketosynthase n=1 Tax=Streptoalloteichus sp. ATCC 53650 TaxID=756733 RepID=K4P152_9PSEU|nr:ketosynthase [Streptoalloteichus sp. ATCC 53650]